MIKEEELIHYLNTKKQIILYGAGMVGGLVKSRLEANHLAGKIRCFAKSLASESDTYMGIKIYSLDRLEDVDADTVLLVCALAETQKEMIQELEIRGYCEYVAISKELFLDLQEHYLEEQQALKKEVMSKAFDVMFFSQDNNATSGAFISMAGLCDEIQKKAGLRILVVLPRYGDGEKLLKENNLEYTYVNRETEWIQRAGSKLEIPDDRNIYYNKDEIQRLRELIHSTGVRLVHISGMFVFAGAIAAKEEGVPVIWHIRENIATQGNCFIQEKRAYELLNDSSAVVCVSDHVFHAYPGLHKNVVRIVYNGADEQKFHERRIVFDSPEIRIVMVGYITHLKGQEVLIRALLYLKQGNHPLPHVTFVGGSDSGYLDHLKKVIAHEGLDPYITFAGRTLEPEIYYKQSDIAISATCGGEGFDRVRIEAMLSGCLLIANDIGAAREIVKDGCTGYLYESGNERSLAQVIIKAMENREESTTIAINGQKLCKERFTKRHNAEQILALYREVMGMNYGREL